MIIAKVGNFIAKLVTMVFRKPKRKPGSLKGKIQIAEDFNVVMQDDILDEFEGKM